MNYYVTPGEFFTPALANGLLLDFVSQVFSSLQWPSRLGLENTPTESLKRGKTPTTSILNITLNKLMDAAPVTLELWVWFGLVSLFNGISTFVGYLMPKLFS